MSKRKNIEKEVPAGEERKCDDCVIGVWFEEQWNRSIIDGKPLTKHCQYRGRGILRGTAACEHWTNFRTNQDGTRADFCVGKW